MRQKNRIHTYQVNRKMFVIFEMKILESKTLKFNQIEIKI